MSLLGEYTKQPVEVEIYSIQFAEDLVSTDQLSSAWQMISRYASPAWNQVVQDTAYTALLSDAERTLVTTANVVLPVAPPEGYRLYVANQSQSTGITVGTILVPARGAVVVAYLSGTWVEEAKTTLALVNAARDQRTRVRVFGGTPWEIYAVQVTVNTSEGRTLQDEFTVSIEEV